MVRQTGEVQQQLAALKLQMRYSQLISDNGTPPPDLRNFPQDITEQAPDKDGWNEQNTGLGSGLVDKNAAKVQGRKRIRVYQAVDNVRELKRPYNSSSVEDPKVKVAKPEVKVASNPRAKPSNPNPRGSGADNRITGAQAYSLTTAVRLLGFAHGAKGNYDAIKHVTKNYLARVRNLKTNQDVSEEFVHETALTFNAFLLNMESQLTESASSNVLIPQVAQDLSECLEAMETATRLVEMTNVPGLDEVRRAINHDYFPLQPLASDTNQSKKAMHNNGELTQDTAGTMMFSGLKLNILYTRAKIRILNFLAATTNVKPRDRNGVTLSITYITEMLFICQKIEHEEQQALNHAAACVLPKRAVRMNRVANEEGTFAPSNESMLMEVHAGIQHCFSTPSLGRSLVEEITGIADVADRTLYSSISSLGQPFKVIAEQPTVNVDGKENRISGLTLGKPIKSAFEQTARNIGGTRTIPAAGRRI